MGKHGVYKYKVGEIVNGLKIIECIRMYKENKRAYIVASTTYLDAPYYNVLERSLIKGGGDAYVSGRRIYEGNSLWSKIEFRKYIIDVEQAKTIAPNHKKPFKFKCPGCDKEKEMLPGTLINQGLSCWNCSKGTSYPELFFISYLEAKGIEYEYQVKFDESQRRIDFKIIINNTLYFVECNGLQHYQEQTSEAWKETHKKTKISDKIKKEYAKSIDVELIELDCRKSTFEFIKKSINDNAHLPKITRNDIENILNIMVKNERYPISEFIEMYTIQKFSTFEIASRFKTHAKVVRDCLIKNDVKLRDSKKKVKCITTGQIFESIEDARIQTGINHISRCCNGQRKSAGKLPDGTKLVWEFITEENESIA